VKQRKPGRFLSSRERHKVADPVCDLSSFVFVVSRIAVPMLVILNKYVRGREKIMRHLETIVVVPVPRGEAMLYVH
jgi:hypothetical protein